MPLVRSQDAGEAFELCTGFLVLHVGAAFCTERVEFGRYFLGEERGDLVDALFFFPHRFFGLVFPLFKHARTGRFFNHAEDLFGAHVEHL